MVEGGAVEGMAAAAASPAEAAEGAEGAEADAAAREAPKEREVHIEESGCMSVMTFVHFKHRQYAEMSALSH
jgi:ribosomal protein L12E/L44/L45/RPP1/RPP2